MNNNRSGGSLAAVCAAGVIQCVFGGIAMMVFGILAVVMAIAIHNGMAASVMMVFFLVGAVLLARGVTNCCRYRAGKRIQAVMSGKDREKLSVLASAARLDLSRLVRELRRLSARGFFPGAYVDLYRRDFVARASSVLPPFVPGPTVLREQRRKPVLPIYAVAACWVAYAVLFPLYRWYHFATAAVFSGVLFLILRKIIPVRVDIVEEARKPEPPPKPEVVNTGNTELDEALNAGMGYMRQLNELGLAITSERIDGPLQELTYICKQIFDEVRKSPEKLRQIRQFLNYYLPTTIKLLKNYSELSREKVRGENIKTAMGKIEEAMQSILTAFQKELDSLYQDRALDISVDIEVMRNMMDQEGLTSSHPDIRAREQA